MKVRGQRPEVGSQRSGCAPLVFVRFVCFVVSHVAKSWFLPCLAYSNFPAPCDSYVDSIRFYPFLCTFYAISMHFLCSF